MKRHPLLWFFALAFGLTWGLGACFALFPAQLIAVFGKVSVTNPLFMLAVYAPSISAIIVTGLVDGTPGIAKLLGRFLRWRNGIQWYAAILIGLPVLSAIALLTSAAFTRTPLAIDHWYQLFLLGPTGHEIVNSLGSHGGGASRLVAVILASFLLDPGPLGEELGWRGFALPRLLEGRSALSASVILGVIWGLWHLPAFLIAGTPQHAMSFPVFMICAIALSVLMTWVFNGTHGSVLMTVLVHWTSNTCFDLTRMPDVLFSAAVLIIAVTVVVALTGPAHLSRSRGRERAVDGPGRESWPRLEAR